MLITGSWMNLFQVFEAKLANFRHQTEHIFTICTPMFQKINYLLYVISQLVKY